jgi:diguanylate cyclase (GGDEF)-like protein/PAS domain S-box-containing protein
VTTLSRPAKAVVTLAVGGGLTTALVALELARRGGTGPLAEVAFFSAAVVASWLWPLVMYRGAESEAVHLDEGFLVVTTLVLPPAGVLVAFGAATVVAQVVRRRPLVKSLFNSGQVLTAAGLGVAAAHAVGVGSGMRPAALAGAAVGAAVFFVVNGAFLAAVLTVTGVSSWRRAVDDGVEIRLLLLGAGVILGLVGGLALSAHPWALVPAALPFAMFCQVLAGHFRARHDRARLNGLFEATLEAHRSMGEAEVTRAVREATRELLRCREVALTDTEPEGGATAVALDVRGTTKWLVAAGRSKAEPFDDADRSLLYALGAVGAGALTNAVLYEDDRRQRERLAAITASLGEGVCALDAEGRVTFLNPAGEAMLGWSEAELASCAAGDIGVTGPVEFLIGPALRAMRTRDTVRSDDTVFRRRDGTSFPVAFTCSPVLDGSRVGGAVTVFRDITERKAFEDRLARHAFHDDLTGLPNRRVFLDRLEQALRRSQRRGAVHAVLFADVDRFKLVNDSVGHQAGDRLLVTIAERLSAALRPGDTLARFGGDEFTVLLEDVSGVADAEGVAARLLESLHAPISLPDGHEVVAAVSIGITLASGTASADDVLHDADVAMYQAKSSGAGRYAVFDAVAMGRRSIDRLDLEAAMRRGLDAGEFEVHYQPVVVTDTGVVVGAEALVRWRHPEQGMLAPGRFIALAEETGLILPLGRLVLEQACWTGQEWRERFGVPLGMSVNLSARQFSDPDLVQDVADILRMTGLRADDLCLEITESLAVEDVVRTIATLEQLKGLGVRLAIDDFGTGYSSLTYLKRFPVDVVKIDRSFVSGVDTEPVDSAIVTAVLGLAAAVGMTTVAEGVETEGQLARLRELECPLVQGYHLGRPCGRDEAAEAVERSLRRDAEVVVG